MDIAPFVEGLRRDLSAAAAPGGPDVARAAELLAGSIDASARLCLLDALSQAADEVTAKLRSASVELRLRGRDAELVVTELAPEPLEPPTPPVPPVPPSPVQGGGTTTSPDASGDVARMTLRLPEGLKDAVERASSVEGISVNAWLVRAIAAAVHGGMPGPNAPPGRGSPRRITGYGRA